MAASGQLSGRPWAVSRGRRHAQLPQILAKRDASDGSQVRSCSGEPTRGDQYLGRGQHAHHARMSTSGARWPPRQQDRHPFPRCYPRRRESL